MHKPLTTGPDRQNDYFEPKRTQRPKLLVTLCKHESTIPCSREQGTATVSKLHAKDGACGSTTNPLLAVSGAYRHREYAADDGTEACQKRGVRASCLGEFGHNGRELVMEVDGRELVQLRMHATSPVGRCGCGRCGCGEMRMWGDAATGMRQRGCGGWCGAGRCGHANAAHPGCGPRACDPTKAMGASGPCAAVPCAPHWLFGRARCTSTDW